jgi:hypothetical protein
VEGLDDVLGVAGGGDAEEDVAGLAEGFDLTLEEVVEAEVVAGGGEDGGVGGEGDGAEGGAVGGEADDWASAAEPPLPATRSLRPASMALAVSSAMVTMVSAMWRSARVACMVAMD